MTHQGRRKREVAAYQKRVLWLSFTANTQAVSIMLMSQFVFFNLHYAIGSTLTVCALLSWTSQLVINVIEWHRIKSGDMPGAQRALDAHFWLNRAFQLLYMPFIVWTVVLMYQRVLSAP